MSIFIPNKKRLARDQKPLAAEYNPTTPASVFDAFYVFESLNPKDLVGGGGGLSVVASPADGGTVGYAVEGHDYGVVVTGGINADSTKFTADTANGIDGFWHDAFDYATIFMDVTFNDDPSGPINLFDLGASSNGVSLSYKISPNTLHISHSNGQNLATSYTFLPGAKRLRILAALSPQGMALYTRYGDGPSQLEASNTVDSSTPFHSDHPGFGGRKGTTVNGNYGWDGDIYALGLSLSHAMSEEEALAFLDDPYQIIKPRETYFPLSTGGANGPTLALQGFPA